MNLGEESKINCSCKNKEPSGIRTNTRNLITTINTTRDTHGTKKELEHVQTCAEDGVSLAMNSTRLLVRCKVG